MNRQALFLVLIGALAYYGFARMRGALDGPPWRPTSAVVGPRSSSM
jgi:hypothetical protein